MKVRVFDQVSPSQIDAFDRCPRKWGFRSLLGFRTAQSAAQSKGSRVHDKNDTYLKTGRLPSPDDQDFKMLCEAKKILPAPGDDLLVECPIQMRTYEGGPLFGGFIDLGCARPMTNIVWVDHKTTSDKRYAKTPAELAENTQMMMYARGTWHLDDGEFVFRPPSERCTPEGLAHIKVMWKRFHMYKPFWTDVKKVGLQHAYILTKGAAKAFTREVDVTREQVEIFWDKKMQVVRTMQHWAKQATEQNGLELVNTMVPNDSACNDYGGCDFKSKCGVHADNNRFKYKKKADTAGRMVPMSTMMDKIKAAKAAKLAEQEKQKSVTVEVASPAPGAVAAAVAEPAKVEAQGIVPPDVTDEKPKYALPQCKVCERTVQLVAGKPGDGKARYYHPGDESEACVNDDKMITPPTVVEAAPVVEAPAAPAAPETQKKKVGRPRKDAPPASLVCGCGATMVRYGEANSYEHPVVEVCPYSGKTLSQQVALNASSEKKGAAAPAAAAAEATVAEKVEQVKEQSKPLAKAMETAKKNTCQFPTCGRERVEGKCPAHGEAEPISSLPKFALYIGCVPTKGLHKTYTLLEDWLQPIAQGLAEEAGVDSHRLVDFKGGAMLAVSVRDWILAGGEVPDVMVTLDGYGPDMKDALSVLVPMAASVVKGL